MTSCFKLHDAQSHTGSYTPEVCTYIIHAYAIHLATMILYGNLSSKIRASSRKSPKGAKIGFSKKKNFFFFFWGGGGGGGGGGNAFSNFNA